MERQQEVGTSMSFSTATNQNSLFMHKLPLLLLFPSLPIRPRPYFPHFQNKVAFAFPIFWSHTHTHWELPELSGIPTSKAFLLTQVLRLSHFLSLGIYTETGDTCAYI